jgi:hypothetical protein
VLDIERAKVGLRAQLKVLAGDLGKNKEFEIIAVGVPAGVGAKISPERARVVPTHPR